MPDVEMFFLKILKILPQFHLNLHCSHQFTGFEALFDFTIHKVRMYETVLFANLGTKF